MRLAKLLFLFQPFLVLIITPAQVYAQNKRVELTDNGYASLTELETIFANILNVITVLAGFAVLLMLVIGAFRYMAAQGDPKAITAARSHMTYAVIGLFFIVVAWLVILFLDEFTGINLTTFTITEPPPFTTP